MGRKSVKDKQAEKVSAINELIDSSDSQVSLIKERWRENYDMFVYGSRNEDKEIWQTKFSVNKLSSSIRAAQGKLVNTLVNKPDWYELVPRSDNNDEAERLARPLGKIIDYYLDAAKFKRHASSFFLSSLINSGSMHIGWETKLIQNPEFVLQETEKSRQSEQQRLAKNVTNPQVEDPSMSGDQLQVDLQNALDEFAAEAQGQTIPKKVIEPYIQIGALKLMDINSDREYWDANVMYMEDSMWRAFDYDVNLWELKYAAKLGYFKPADIDNITSGPDLIQKATSDLRYKNIIAGRKSKADMVKLRVYYGPLIIDGEIEEDKYFCIIANNGSIIKEGSYPFWEPPGHHTPVITAAVRQIPFRATGAGIGDNAVALQKVYDSNWQLVCDTFRFGISGVNVVNHQNLVDKSQLLEGLYPGITLEVRGKPEDSFQHIALTNNSENQVHPVQTMLEGAIDQLTGINELMVGGGNQYSRTSAAETNAKLGAGSDNVNIIALDLESKFLIPALEKCFARVLQFGIPELNTNPELQSLLSEEELSDISQLNAGGRMEILNRWYNFKVNGFSSAQDKNDALMRSNELLTIINSNGPLTPLINLPEFMKEHFALMDIKDPERLLIIDQSPFQQVTQENQVLMAGHMIMPNQNDDHNFHLQHQMPLAQSPYATPMAQQHAQIHMQMLQQMQQATQGQGGQQPPPQGAPQAMPQGQPVQ